MFSRTNRKKQRLKYVAFNTKYRQLETVVSRHLKYWTSSWQKQFISQPFWFFCTNRFFFIKYREIKYTRYQNFEDQRAWYHLLVMCIIYYCNRCIMMLKLNCVEIQTTTSEGIDNGKSVHIMVCFNVYYRANGHTQCEVKKYISIHVLILNNEV